MTTSPPGKDILYCTYSSSFDGVSLIIGAGQILSIYGQ